MRYIWNCSWTTVELFEKFFSLLRCIRIDALLFFTLWCSYSCFIHWHIILLNKMLWRPPAVIIEYQDMTLSYPSHTPSTRFPTGTVLALPAAFWFKDYHPWLSHHFSSCGSHYPETPRTFGLCVSMTKPATYTIDTLP